MEHFKSQFISERAIVSHVEMVLFGCTSTLLYNIKLHELKQLKSLQGTV